jgi:hypothetical protein
MKYFSGFLATMFCFVVYSFARSVRDVGGSRWWFLLEIAAWVTAINVVAYVQYSKAK